MQTALHKQAISKAIQRLQARVAEADPTILQDIGLDLGQEESLPLFRTRRQELLILRMSPERELELTAATWSAAIQHAALQDDDQSRRSLCDEYRAHWQADGGDAAEEAARVLLTRVDVALQLLCTSGRYNPQTTTTTAMDMIPHQQTTSDMAQLAYPAQSEPDGQHALQGQTQESQSVTPPALQGSHLVRGRNLSRNAMDSLVSYEHTFRLPKFELPLFSGEIETFPEFWDAFETAVHRNPSIPLTVKFHYLKSRLSGDALAMLSGYDITDDNYSLAVITLKETYYRPQFIRTRLSVKLQELPPAHTSALHQRTTLAHLKSLWAQLKKFGEQDSNIFAMRLIRSKFPQKTLEHLGYIETADANPWHVPQLLAGLDKAIRTFETIADTSTGRSIEVQALTTRSNSRSPSRERPMRHARGRVQSRFHARGRHTASPQRVCTFCSRQNHSASDCQFVTHPRARRTIVYSENLCAKCFAANHRADTCAKPPCTLCRGSHHISICRLQNARSPSRSRNSQRSFPPTDRRSPIGRHKSPDEKAHRSPRSNRRRTESAIPRRVRFTDRQSDQNFVEVRSEEDESDTDAVETDWPKSLSFINHITHKEASPRLMIVTAVTRNKCTDDDELLVLLLDSGAQHSFIKEDTALRLGLSFSKPCIFTTRTFGGHSATETSSLVFITLYSSDGTPKNLALRTSKITTSICAQHHMFRRDLNTLFRERRSRPNTSLPIEEVDIDILIGIDHYWEIVYPERNHRLPSGMMLTATCFGPVLSGSRVEFQSHSYSTLGQDVIREPDGDIDQNIHRMWSLESVGITDDPSPRADDDINAEVVKRYYATVQVSEGAIHVQFPWKESHPRLFDNKQVAFRRLERQFQTLSPNRELWKQYARIFEEQLQAGIVEEVTEFAFDGPQVYYMPHRAVFKEDSSTTAVRIVFDASSHAKGSPSLNDCLHQGPSLLPDLAGTLLRTRLSKYLLIADVEKAFHQIHLQRDQRDATRFLWLKDTSRPPSPCNIRFLRFTRVVFGINVSPFLLNMSIRYVLERDSQNSVREELLANTYVDNVFIGATRTDECVAKREECKQAFLRMHMNLREFMCNNIAVMNTIPVRDRMKRLTDTVKLLGIRWHPEHDTLQIRLKFKPFKANTKRVVLRAVASNFDPLGYLSPLLVQAKIFIQDLWKEQYDWDEEFCSAYITRWQEIIRLNDGFTCTLPRFITQHNTHPEYELLIFADASIRVYATAAYLLCRTEGGGAQSHLLMARSPPEGITIPRLELMALHASAKLATFLTKEMPIHFSAIRLFSDSLIALHWVHSNKPLKTFISNRVKNIRQLLEALKKPGVVTTFHYVTSESNPADCATRGLSAKEIVNHTWWNGPKFVLTPTFQWPNSDVDFSVTPMEANLEYANTLIIPAHAHQSVIPFARVSDYEKLIRITAFVLKFIRKQVIDKLSPTARSQYITESPFEQVTQSSAITAQDYITATFIVTREHQRECEFHILAYSAHNIRIVKDQSGLLRVDNRMSNERNAKIKPAILWPDHPLTESFVIYKHRQLHHAGTAHLLSALRQSVVIPRMRRTVKTIIGRCIICKRLQGRPYAYPDSPDLPVERVIANRPFQKVGLDYFGPFSAYTNPPTTLKLWICLFTCMTTRAIHLELVYDNSSREFVLAFRRFIARRGSPDLVISDNAPTFKLGKQVFTNELLKFEKDPSVCNFAAQNALRWNFITPHSPWKGGFYERLVGITKSALKKTIGRSTPDIRTLETILVEIESILNTRPLTPVHTNTPDEVSTLRPIDLIAPYFHLPLYASTITSQRAKDSAYYFTTITDSETQQSLQLQHDMLHDSLDYFWSLWHEDYLHTLSERSQRRRQSGQYSRTQPKVGDVVLIKQPNVSRSLWPLGVITRLNTTEDGLLRSVQLKTGSNSFIDRALKHLIPLELHTSHEDIEDQQEPSTQQDVPIPRNQPSRRVKKKR